APADPAEPAAPVESAATSVATSGKLTSTLTSSPASRPGMRHTPIVLSVDVHVFPLGQPLPPVPRQPSMHAITALHTRPESTAPVPSRTTTRRFTESYSA